MKPGSFYYSTNGAQAVGPVTEERLRELWENRQIGPGSLLWREGESHWTPIASDAPVAADLTRVRARRIVPSEVFASVAKKVSHFVPDESAGLPSPKTPEAVAAPSANVKAEAPVAVKETPAPAAPVKAVPVPVVVAPPPETPAPGVPVKTPPDEGAPGVIINTVAGLAAVAGIVISTLLAKPPQGDSSANVSFQIGGVVSLLAVIVFLPYILTYLLRGMPRVFIRALLIIGLAFTCVASRIHESGILALTEVKAMNDQQKKQAKKEIAAKGLYSADTSQAEQNIRQLKSQITDDSERSRVSRDILSVTSDLLAKVKTSDDLEANCKFTLDGVKSANDFTGQISAIALLRNAQNDVVLFLHDYDQHCRDALAKDHVTPEMQTDVIAGARNGAHVDLLITLWQEKMQLSADHITRFAFLQKNWGHWQFTGGLVNFTDDAQAADYDKLVEAIRADVDKIRDTQRQIFQ